MVEEHAQGVGRPADGRDARGVKIGSPTRVRAMLQQNAVFDVLKERLVRTFTASRSDALDEPTVEGVIDRLMDGLEHEGVPLDVEVRRKLQAKLLDELVGLGDLHDLMRDPSVTEIMVNAGGRQVFVERNGVKQPEDLKLDGDEVRAIVARMLLLSPGRRLDASCPMVDLSLPGGTRVNIAIPPIVSGGPHLTLRKYLRSIRALDDLVAFGTLDERMARFLIAAVRARANVLVAGAAGTGKTTLVDVLSRHLDPKERIVVIEDTLELRFEQPDVVRMLSRPPNVEGRGEITIGDLFRNALRMRPTRIVLGEIRGREALDWLQAINSGHRGTMAVIHAASPEEALVRVEHLVALAGHQVPLPVVHGQIARGLDLIVQLAQEPDGTRKIVRISEVAGQDSADQVLLRDLFQFEDDALDDDGRVTGRFVATGVLPALLHQIDLVGMHLDPGMFREPGTH